jgi:hypothetical protein
MTEYRLLGASVRRPDKRFGQNQDKPDAYVALTISVGKSSKYTEIVLSNVDALLLAEKLLTAVRQAGASNGG